MILPSKVCAMLEAAKIDTRIQQQVRIVLVDTSHAGNIGAAARAMKNMGLNRLYLVNPKLFPHADATARASGADDVLAQATVCADLDEALAGCTLVVGASARLRNLSVPLLDPHQCAAQVLSEMGGGANTECAIVFGREHSGLTNDELGRCHHLVHIPSNPEYSSLNLAAAVQVVSYELRMADIAASSSNDTRSEQAVDAVTDGAGVQAEDEALVEGEVVVGDELLAPAEDMARFYEHLEQTLVEIEFLDPQKPGIMMRRLRRLFNRSRPNVTEMNILRGILTAAQKRKRNPK